MKAVETDTALEAAVQQVLDQTDPVFAAHWLPGVADAYYRAWDGTEPLSASTGFRQALAHVIDLHGAERARAAVIAALEECDCENAITDSDNRPCRLRHGLAKEKFWCSRCRKLQEARGQAENPSASLAEALQRITGPAPSPYDVLAQERERQRQDP